MGKNLKIIKTGIIDENPCFVQLLGMCPTLGVTTSAINGFGMGLATTAVLIMSNSAISLLRKVIPSKIRIPAFIVVIASAVTIIGMLMEAYMNALYGVLGLFIPLIVVNCIILARAEAFAFENTVLPSALDGLGMGLGFTLALTLLGTVREFFGAFKFFNIPFTPEAAEPMLIMIQPPGAFLTLALLLALYNYHNIRKERKAKAIVDKQREEDIAAQLEATRISEEKWKKKQEEKKQKEKEKKAAEAAKKKAEEEAAKAAAANGEAPPVSDAGAEAPKVEEPMDEEAARKAKKRAELKAKKEAEKAAKAAAEAPKVEEPMDEEEARKAKKRAEIKAKKEAEKAAKAAAEQGEQQNEASKNDEKVDDK